MDNKTFVARVAKQMNMDANEAAQLVSELVSLIQERTADTDTVAIPGLGAFVPVKKPDRVNYDSATGNLMLMPPQVLLEFVPASKLVKSLTNE